MTICRLFWSLWEEELCIKILIREWSNFKVKVIFFHLIVYSLINFIKNLRQIWWFSCWPLSLLYVLKCLMYMYYMYYHHVMGSSNISVWHTCIWWCLAFQSKRLYVIKIERLSHIWLSTLMKQIQHLHLIHVDKVLLNVHNIFCIYYAQLHLGYKTCTSI